MFNNISLYMAPISACAAGNLSEESRPGFPQACRFGELLVEFAYGVLKRFWDGLRDIDVPGIVLVY
jgi:hypothetical protein